jgi:multiple sugar transport system ATP-binding protein
MASVRLEQITRQFGSTRAIDAITFTVPDGEFWVLVGPSGCGKSTILRTIAGLETATSGDLYIGDQRVNELPARQRDVAMVFQNYALYPHLSVAENLGFGLQMRQIDAKTRRDRVEAVAQLLEIGHLLDRKPRQLSGGQQQRVALGRAIVRQPQVFLLDEPLSNLDAQLRDGTRTELKQLHQQVGITTIYVTHDQVEAMTLADRIVVLHQGRIQQIDEPQAVYARPANRMVAAFLGNPPMNLLTATYTGTGFQIGDQILICPPIVTQQLQPAVGQCFELGIRPEHLQVAATGDLTVTATVVEPLGREILVLATLPTANGAVQSLQIQVPPTQRLKAGDDLTLQVDFEQLFVFDPGTGNVLYPQRKMG